MSSDAKDARWELATQWAEAEGCEFSDYGYDGWQIRLDEAEKTIGHNPLIVYNLARMWRTRSE